MKRMLYNTASRRHTFIAILGITVLFFSLLVSITGATQNSAAWDNKGIALCKLGKFDEAITAYDKAIEVDPQNSGAWYNKGRTLNKLNMSDEAIKAYDKVIELNPQDSIGWIGKGRALG